MKRGSTDKGLQVFNVPKDEDGALFLALARRFKSPRYVLRRRPRGDWKGRRHNITNERAEGFAVYVDLKPGHGRFHGSGSFGSLAFEQGQQAQKRQDNREYTALELRMVELTKEHGRVIRELGDNEALMMRYRDKEQELARALWDMSTQRDKLIDREREMIETIDKLNRWDVRTINARRDEGEAMIAAGQGIVEDCDIRKEARP